MKEKNKIIGKMLFWLYAQRILGGLRACNKRIGCANFLELAS
jgi:hypothetical protein